MQPFRSQLASSPPADEKRASFCLTLANETSPPGVQSRDPDIFAMTKSASTLDSAPSFSSIASHIPDLNESSNVRRTCRLSSLRGSPVEDPSRLTNSELSLDSFKPTGSPSSVSAMKEAFHPASLPVPRKSDPTGNIWASPLGASTNSSSSGTDFDTHSPLNGHSTLLSRRFSHLGGSNSCLTRPLIGSPTSLVDINRSTTLGLDHCHANLSPTSPSLVSRGFGPNSLPATFYEPWGDSSLSSFGVGDEERIGRSRARDILGARYHHNYRDPSVGSIGSPCSSSTRSGIGLSNMSPFTGTTLLPPGAVSFGGGPWGASQHADLFGRSNRARDSSLGAIGTGRMNPRSSVLAVGAIGSGVGLNKGSRILNNRGSNGSVVGSAGSTAADSWFMGGRSLSNDLDEDDEFAPPTRSGATSRRHSMAAFTGRNFAQGFEPINSRPILPSGHPGDKKYGAEMTYPPPGAELGSFDNQANSGLMFGRGNLALTDEDLLFSSTLSSLNLNLEAHAQQQRHPTANYDLGHPSSGNSEGSVEISQPHTPRFQLSRGPSSPSLTVRWRNPGSCASQAPQPAPPPPPPVGQLATGNQRRSSFSAGDPFSASAQASRYFAAQADKPALVPSGTQPPGPRFPLGLPRAVPQPSASLSGSSVTTFSAGGLLSTTSSHPNRHQLHADLGPPNPGPLGAPPSPFDAFAASSFYPSLISPPQASTSPLLNGAPTTSSLSAPSGLAFAFPNSSASLSGFTSTPGPGPHELGDLGKGLPLNQLPRGCSLFIVEFKGGRTDLFYFSAQGPSGDFEQVQRGDLVIVEADRGKDLGKVLRDSISIDDVQKFQSRQVELALNQLTSGSGLAGQSNGSAWSGADTPLPLGGSNSASIARLTKEIHPKRIFGKATQADVAMLASKVQDESKALALCRSKALQRGLKMEITSAEWQWDRRKLTFFFIADKRIDFRDLVKDLFKTWKTRIWMCSVNPS